VYVSLSVATYVGMRGLLKAKKKEKKKEKEEEEEEEEGKETGMHHSSSLNVPFLEFHLSLLLYLTFTFGLTFTAASLHGFCLFISLLRCLFFILLVHSASCFFTTT
jgi:hypothetical protein